MGWWECGEEDKGTEACSDSQSLGQVDAGSRLLLHSCGAMHTKM